MDSNINTPPRFAEILEFHLNLKIQKFQQKTLTRSLMQEMYQTIRDVVYAVFSKSSLNPTTATKDWISQKYYENIKMGDRTLLTGDPETWDHTVSPVYEGIDISKLPSDELRLLGGLFNEMVFADDIHEEIRKRS